jgi:choline dehydrogenase-like flavoprotein
MARSEPVDVVVVGTGMGGAAFAWQISRLKPDLKVLCLERGGWLRSQEMPTLTTSWQSAAFGKWATSPNLRLGVGGNPYSADYLIDDTATPIKPLMWNGIGGSTINWAAHFPRMKPADFGDWPFDYEDLEPYYDLNDAILGVAKLAGDPAYPQRCHRLSPLVSDVVADVVAALFPPLPIGRMGERAARAFNALGWHWWPAASAILTARSGDRGPCNNCGPCLQGCVPRAKASTDVTYLPRAVAQGVEIRDHATAVQIIIEGGRAKGVTYRDAEGREHEQRAAAVVVAGNGIGTARLLLASGAGGEAAGRYLMMHPVAYARGLFREELDGPKGPVGASLYSHEFYESDPSRGFDRGFQIQVTRENSLLAQALRLAPNWGRQAQYQLTEEFRHSMAWMTVTNDAAEPHNQVSISREIAADGLPTVKVEYTVSAGTQAAIGYAYERADEFYERAGAFRVVRAPLPPYTGWHLLGTARMGRDPQTSVTDAQGRVHGVEGLIIADGSVMPSGGAVNPGSTIGALALKFAEDLAEEMA